MRDREYDDLREKGDKKRQIPITFKAAVIISIVLASAGIISAVSPHIIQGGEAPPKEEIDDRMAVFLSITISSAETENGTYLNLPVADCLYLILKGELISEDGPISEMDAVLTFLYGSDLRLSASSPGLGEKDVLSKGNETSYMTEHRLSRSTPEGMVGISITVWEDVE
ncbi:MAG: hypothetical protein QCI82_11590 [Candidatus Thermoplasmatota archaeon]|nr:hypothetical protein [Candidatus Thermoplasmatota archaeon]